MSETSPKACIIYCRVSSKEQVEGTSLENQERLCREYAEQNGLVVLKVFVEMGESAKTADRTEFTKAIAFCTQKKGRVHQFIVYKIDRFARNQDDHVVVRSLLKRAGTELRSATETFDESAMGRAMEGMLSVFAEFDNNNRRERCKGGMQARVREGIWCWPSPLGYYKPATGKKTNIVPEPDRAPLIRLAFETYAKGTYTFKELAQFLGDRGLRTRQGKYPFQQMIEKILTKPVYYGRIDAFGELVKGDFKPIIDEALFVRCQAVKRGLHMNGKPRQFNNPGFPLRRFVVCQHCNQPLTGSYARGKKGKRYPYYHHGSLKCAYSKSMPKEAFEAKFVKLLESIEPDAKHEKLFKAVVLDAWQERYKKFDDANVRVRKEIEKLEHERQTVFDFHRLGKYSDDEFVVQKKLVNERIDQKCLLLQDARQKELNMEKALDYCFYFVRNASKIWLDLADDYEARLNLQHLIFAKPLTFDGNSFGTPELSLIFAQKKNPLSDSSSLVARRGVEPLLTA